MRWTPDRLPDLNGKTFVITGGNSGLGLEAAKILAAKGGRVVITTRSEAKAEGALATLRDATEGADVDFALLDLADTDSIREGADAVRAKAPRIDAIINNAGVMQTPERRTNEGWELQFATNHLGHFRLNSLLFDVLDESGARVVPVASIAHKFGGMNWEDPQFTTGYNPSAAYFQSKLANLMYGFELNRRLAERSSAARAIPCHPGYSATNLQSAGVGMDGGPKLWGWVYSFSNVVMAQSANAGAFPLCLAAADPDAKPGTYYGPRGLGQMRGPVGESFVHKRARDEADWKRLWDLSEELVGPFFPA